MEETVFVLQRILQPPSFLPGGTAVQCKQSKAILYLHTNCPADPCHPDAAVCEQAHISPY